MECKCKKIRILEQQQLVRLILYLKDSKIIFEGQQIKGQKGAVSSKKDLPSHFE